MFRFVSVGNGGTTPPTTTTANITQKMAKKHTKYLNLEVIQQKHFTQHVNSRPNKRHQNLQQRQVQSYRREHSKKKQKNDNKNSFNLNRANRSVWTWDKSQFLHSFRILHEIPAGSALLVSLQVEAFRKPVLNVGSLLEMRTQRFFLLGLVWNL